jgi:type IV pilus assembly protein PilB
MATATPAPTSPEAAPRDYSAELRIAKAEAVRLGLPFLDLRSERVDPDALALLSRALCERRRLLPVRQTPTSLLVAAAHPGELLADVLACDDLRMRTRRRIEVAAADPSALENCIARYYLAPDQAPEAHSNGHKPAREPAETLDPETRAALEAAEQAPVVRTANTVLQQAIRDHASDIHIELDRVGVRVRYRIDGVLHEALTLPVQLHLPLVSRLKILADVNIAERRVPQDGRISMTYEGREFDLRVSTLPTLGGEEVVIRILDRNSEAIGLEKLGLLPHDLERLDSVIAQPNGLILSTGPTGSGKTTTQYSVLHRVNSMAKKILTVEDPVEYHLPGISQVHVNRKAGLTMAKALRAFLRQDPDIIMVGEIRDRETAEVAIEAALTGHLVLSTLHTNDAPSAITRLVDMGVEPFLLSATLVGVLAQRLARRVCPDCGTSRMAPASELRRLGGTARDRSAEPQGSHGLGATSMLTEAGASTDEESTITLRHGLGCELCRKTGYRGRTGIYEMMLVDEELAELISARVSTGELRQAARRKGMRLLREDGLEKVRLGWTTPDEVSRVVFTAGH